jgi:hypothetical protein
VGATIIILLTSRLEASEIMSVSLFMLFCTARHEAGVLNL